MWRRRSRAAVANLSPSRAPGWRPLFQSISCARSAFRRSHGRWGLRQNKRVSNGIWPADPQLRPPGGAGLSLFINGVHPCPVFPVYHLLRKVRHLPRMNAPQYMAVRLHLNNLIDQQFVDSSHEVREDEVCLGPRAALRTPYCFQGLPLSRSLPPILIPELVVNPPFSPLSSLRLSVFLGGSVFSVTAPLLSPRPRPARRG